MQKLTENIQVANLGYIDQIDGVTMKQPEWGQKADAGNAGNVVEGNGCIWVVDCKNSTHTTIKGLQGEPTVDIIHG